jgi:imidazolonepropionase-like amidohydrolase
MAARDRGIFAALVAAEIPLLVSTEAYAGGVALWGASVHDEMRELVNAGASPGIALRAATLEPARALGRDRELGRVAAGYRADLVLLDADPLQNIENTRRIHAVIIGGRVLDKGELDGLRASLTKRAGP